jgi:hypothetical protein
VGLFILWGISMLPEPAIKRARAYIDGQNLFHSAKEAFGYSFPNDDIKALVTEICRAKGWQLDAIHFYTGIPDATVGRTSFLSIMMLTIYKSTTIHFAEIYFYAPEEHPFYAQFERVTR